LIDKVRPQVAAGLCGVLALAAWAVSAAVPATSADRQQRFVIEHATNTVTGKAYWSIVNDHAPLPEAYRSIGNWKWTKLPYIDRLRWLAPALPVAGTRAPVVEVVSNTPSPGGRNTTFRIHANGADRVVITGTKDAQIRTAGVAGFVRPIDPKAKGNYQFVCSGRSCNGLTMQFTTAVKVRTGFTVIGSRSGLPEMARPLVAGRPQFARPQYLPDETVTISRIWL
jgi:hypothetical protein